MITGSGDETWKTGASETGLISTIAQMLAGAIKHHTLYPEDHSIASQHIKRIHELFRLFFKKNTSLHLAVGKSTLLFDGSVIYEGKPEENDIAFLLGRDGVEWIEFSRDLELWEIQSLLGVINANRRSDAEHDGNISNALWEKDLPHIEYKTLDLMAMDLPMLNLNSFRVAPEPTTGIHKGQAGMEGFPKDDVEPEPDDLETEPEEADQEEETGFVLTAPGSSLWNLTRAEELQLQAMVNLEENGTHTESTIAVLFILLLTQNDRRETGETLAFLQDRFLYCLQNQEFIHGLQIIRTLKKIETVEHSRRQWLCPLIHDLIDTVSRPESLRDLKTFFNAPEGSVPEKEQDALWELLRTLPPEVLKTLAPLSCSIDMDHFGAPFLAIFEHFGAVDAQSLASVIKETDSGLCLRLFPFLNRIRTRQAIPILTAMALHAAPLVRGKAFSILARWGEVDLDRLFGLVDDPDPEIRGTILSLAGKRRHPGVEQMLLSYLERSLENTNDREHLLACFLTLGKSGSSRSIPFLQKCLLQRSSLGTLFASGGGVLKEGAARALWALKIPEARNLVQEGAANILPDVRSACRRAMGKRHG